MPVHSYSIDRKELTVLHFLSFQYVVIMKNKFISFVAILPFVLLAVPSLEAGYTIHKGRIVNSLEDATMSAQAHFDAGACAYNAGDWEEAYRQFNIVTINYPTSVYGQEAFYFLGVSYFFLEEYDFANEAFSEYLKVQNNPRYFQSAVEFKFSIAEQLNAGARCRPFCTKQLPKWLPGQTLALKIYDEVIAAVPCHEIAAQALMAKGCLLWRWQDYRPAVESFQMALRRFPKYERAPDCYLYIGKIFLEQSRWEFQNSDILAFAELNLRRFEREFPREERLCEAEADVMAIKEIYANGLYETGRFYERTCKPRAAIIYYNDAIRQFPETCVASLCRDRMSCLHPEYFEGLPETVMVLDESAIEKVDSFDEEEDLDVPIDLEDSE